MGGGAERPSARDEVLFGAVAVAVAAIGGALLPGLARRLRWSQRLGWRGVVASAGLNALLGFGIRQWLRPRAERWVEEQNRTRAHARDELRRRLGREPTDHEIVSHLITRAERAT